MPPPHHLTITGEGVRTLQLDFDSIPDSRRWLQQVARVRADATLYAQIQQEEVKSVYLACTFIPSGEYLGEVWGEAYVPSDITENLAWARNKIQIDPPDPVLVSVHRQLLINDLHDALRRES